MSQTKYTGLIGHPIAHSISPMLHNRVYQRVGLDIVYLAHDIPPIDLKEAIEGLKALDYLGFNVTIPYKESIIDYLDGIDPTARAIGAVNTVKNVHGRLIGYNTDGLGFMQSIKSTGIKCRHRTIAILGAGGAARAIGLSLAKENPKKIYIINRGKKRGQKLVRDINNFLGREISILREDVPRHTDMIINTTPIGMWPDMEGNPLADYLLTPDTIVCDIVYNPLETSMLKQAKRSGCITLSGIGMLVGQGMKALEIWTGTHIDEYTTEWITHELIEYMDPPHNP